MIQRLAALQEDIILDIVYSSGEFLCPIHENQLLLRFPGFLDCLGRFLGSDGSGSKIRGDVVHDTAHVGAEQLVVDDLQIR